MTHHQQRPWCVTEEEAQNLLEKHGAMKGAKKGGKKGAKKKAAASDPYAWNPSMEKNTPTTKAVAKGNKAAAVKAKAAAKAAGALAKARLMYEKLAGNVETIRAKAKLEKQEAED